MRIVILVIAAMLLVVGAASASLDNWQVKCGLGDNVAGYGNDYATIFGVAPTGTYTMDGDDASHPTISSALNDLGFIYVDTYSDVYENQILHPVGPFSWSAPVGWAPPWGGHGDGTLPDYGSDAPGLIKDTRAPVLGVGEPEIWQVMAYAPNDGETCSFIWDWNSAPGYEVPDNMEVKIWGNSQLESAGIYGDLVLSNSGDGVHKIEGIAQWGTTTIEIMPGVFYTYANPSVWVIQATLVPEPAVAQLAGLVLGIAGLGIARFRRK